MSRFGGVPFAPDAENKKRRIWRALLVDAPKEIGVLILAFAPLDAALDTRALEQIWPEVVVMMVIGLVLFVLSLYNDWRLPDAK